MVRRPLTCISSRVSYNPMSVTILRASGDLGTRFLSARTHSMLRSMSGAFKRWMTCRNTWAVRKAVWMEESASLRRNGKGEQSSY